jgi:hypothetical protein
LSVAGISVEDVAVATVQSSAEGSVECCTGWDGRTLQS